MQNLASDLDASLDQQLHWPGTLRSLAVSWLWQDVGVSSTVSAIGAQIAPHLQVHLNTIQVKHVEK